MSLSCTSDGTLTNVFLEFPNRSREISVNLNLVNFDLPSSQSQVDCMSDVPPILSSAAVWSPSPGEKEIGCEAMLVRADHRLPA